MNFSQNTFKSDEAILLAAMCHQANLLIEEGEISLPAGYSLRYVINALAGVEEPEPEPFGFIAESKKDVIIAFRGTDSFKDNESDQDLYQIPYPFVKDAGKTHRGFTCIYQSARDSLIRELMRIPTKKKLYIAGYSLGGGLSVISAFDIAVNTGFKSPVVYTFGSPRAGDPEFVHHYNQRVRNSTRIFNVHDIIPTLPAKSYPPPFTKEGLYYRHVDNGYPLSFQLNSIARNHFISCYFHTLSELNPGFTNRLCTNNPDFCPDTSICTPADELC
jgi:triacylglycerol lipase